MTPAGRHRLWSLSQSIRSRSKRKEGRETIGSCAWRLTILIKIDRTWFRLGRKIPSGRYLVRGEQPQPGYLAQVYGGAGPSKVLSRRWHVAGNAATIVGMTRTALQHNAPANDPIFYAGYRFPPDVISYAVWLCYRFPLSLRMRFPRNFVFHEVVCKLD